MNDYLAIYLLISGMIGICTTITLFVPNIYDDPLYKRLTKLGWVFYIATGFFGILAAGIPSLITIALGYFADRFLLKPESEE